jgi:hypothetical protein
MGLFPALPGRFFGRFRNAQAASLIKSVAPAYRKFWISRVSGRGLQAARHWEYKPTDFVLTAR